MMFGATRPEFRQERRISKAIDFATDFHDSPLHRTALPDDVLRQPQAPALALLRERGFCARPWKQLTRTYDEDSFSILGQFFWDAFDTNRLPFQFGESRELVMTLADDTHIAPLASLRRDLARSLGYATNYDQVEQSTAQIIQKLPGTDNRSVLLAVMRDDRVIASLRVAPGYNIWEGMLRLSIRDIVIALPHTKRGLLPWIFSAAVVAGRLLIHPDNVVNAATRAPEPISVETWLPTEGLVKHFRSEIPGLGVTGCQFFENY
jgi:hypothetical protein